MENTPTKFGSLDFTTPGTARERRLKIIHRMTYDAQHAGLKVTSTDFTRECRVTDRCILEDIAYGKNVLAWPIEFNQKEKTWRFTKHVDYNPTFLVTEGVYFALMLCEKAMNDCQSLSQRRALLSIFKKIQAHFTDTITFNFDTLDDSISFGTTFQPKFNPTRVEYLCRCVARRTQLWVNYDTPKKGKRRRKINPFHVRKINRDWILYCYDYDRKKVIRLALGRMHDIEESGETFEKPTPEEFTLKKELKGAIAIWSGGEETKVTLYYHPDVAHNIRENDVNCDIGRRHLPDGGLELDLLVTSLMEIPLLIGEYGENAYPLSPPELVKEYARTGRAMVAAVGEVM